MSFFKDKEIVERWLEKKGWWYRYVVGYLEHYSGKEKECLAK